MVLCLATSRFPTITLTTEEQRYYDQFSKDLLKRTLLAFHEEQRPDLNRKQWAHVRRRDKMDVYKNIERSTNPRVTLYVGKGLMIGTVDDMMDGLYCDTTEDLRKVKTLLNYKFIDGAVFQVMGQHSPEYVECFFQGHFYARGKVLQRVSDYAMAGKWLAVSNAIQCAQAKKFSRLMESADVKLCYPSDVCDVCHSRAKSNNAVQCAGCMQLTSYSDDFDRTGGGSSITDSILDGSILV
eukprot:jgi/Phyca11/17282/fgenesh1_pg.PHYCAscaffold_26_\